MTGSTIPFIPTGAFQILGKGVLVGALLAATYDHLKGGVQRYRDIQPQRRAPR